MSCDQSVFSELAALLSFSSQETVEGLEGCRAWTLLTARGGVVCWGWGPGTGLRCPVLGLGGWERARSLCFPWHVCEGTEED